MKKIIFGLGGLVGLLIIAVIVLATVDFNRAGKDTAYLEVIAPTEELEEVLNSGEVMTRYKYVQDAYDEKGETVPVEFTAGKRLREGAYLMIYFKGNNEVTSYDEVKWDDVPEAAKGKLS